MKKMTAYFLSDSGFRGDGPPRSDTVFGALCWAWRLLFGAPELELLLMEFHDGPPPFLISSMFRFHKKDGHKIHYFPKPLTMPLSVDFPEQEPTLKELQALKAVDRLATVNGEEFSDILYGHKRDKAFYEDALRKSDTSGLRLQDSQDVLISGGDFPVSWPGEQGGLFCCLKCRSRYEQRLRTLFHFLADKGIGGGVSIGKGHIRRFFLRDGLPYDEPPEHECPHVITLSLTLPCEQIQKDLEHACYDLETRQGKIESMYTHSPPQAALIKDRLLMLKEGSVFPKQEHSLYYGRNSIVRKDDGTLGFDVWHYGYAFPVNTKHLQ